MYADINIDFDFSFRLPLVHRLMFVTLAGGFPNVANLHQLKELSANFCSLTGLVPDIFENFPLLEVTYFDGNGFHG